MERIYFPALSVLLYLIALTQSKAADWPQWRYDEGHGAVTPQELPEQMHLQWTRQLVAASPAWPTTQSKLDFDTAPEPVVTGNRILVPHSATDSVTAYDTVTGKELWRFYAEGPVRFAPVTNGDKAWFVSDDGYLYCLDVTNGKLLWKFNGGPSERRGLAHGRLISSWPARGGPVHRDGKIWFTASIWPFMGIFIHCIDAATGTVIWTNSGNGMNYTVQPHGAPSFATVAPQGHLTLAGKYLVVPGGRSTPAVLEADTGKLLHFKYDKKRGNHQVLAGGDSFYVDGGRYQLSDGKSLGGARPQLISSNRLFSLSGNQVSVQGLTGREETITRKDRKGNDITEHKFTLKNLWAAKINSEARQLFLQAGNRLYTGGENLVAGFDVTLVRDEKPDPVWSAPIKGKPWTMLAADNRLFVMTRDSRLHCFGSRKTKPTHHEPSRNLLPEPDKQATSKIQSILKHLNTTEGHALLLGADDDSLTALLHHTKFQIVVVDTDSKKVDAMRRLHDAAGLYGQRITILHRDNPAEYPAPPYFANLVLVDGKLSSKTNSTLQSIYNSVRPYGGILCLDNKAAQLQKEAEALPNARILEKKKDRLIVKKEGALPGTSDWSHQYADAGQSVVSRDNMVKPPLGLLWFGGPSNAKILPRHGHGPSPQVAGGRLFIEGADIIRAVDVYTGRLLWERELKDVGKYYNITAHFAGAGEIGSNYVSMPDAVYVVYGTRILELDVNTGQTKKEFSLPNDPNFGWLSVHDDYLVTTIAPIAVKLTNKGKDAEVIESRFASGSRQLAVFNRQTGKLLWTRDARFNFRHNNIALGANSVFVIDSLTESRRKALDRRGIKLKGKPALHVLNIKDGNVRWETDQEVFGTFLNYSAEHDLLLQAGSAFRDRAKDDIGKGMIAYQGRSGKVIWANRDLSYSGPCLLMKDRIITNGNGGFALNIKTGKPTGWKYTRNYGCNTAIGSEHLLTFRSGAAGFYDLKNDGGTGNWGGFRSSCTANLIPANGVLNAPDYTRTCSCAYQVQTSLGLIHMPELEYWTFGAEAKSDKIAINLGAPGDRRDPDGRMWLEYPEVGGPSTKVDVSIEPKDASVFRVHSTAVESGELKWIAASGLEGAKSVRIAIKENGNYQVKLHFMEPRNISAGKRVFDVALQGETVLSKLDVADAAGGYRKAIVKDFNVAVQDNALKIELFPQGKQPAVLSGIQWHSKP